jgi:hypothetical protein
LGADEGWYVSCRTGTIWAYYTDTAADAGQDGIVHVETMNEACEASAIRNEGGQTFRCYVSLASHRIFGDPYQAMDNAMRSTDRDYPPSTLPCAILAYFGENEKDLTKFITGLRKQQYVPVARHLDL